MIARDEGTIWFRDGVQKRVLFLLQGEQEFRAKSGVNLCSPNTCIAKGSARETSFCVSAWLGWESMRGMC